MAEDKKTPGGLNLSFPGGSSTFPGLLQMLVGDDEGLRKSLFGRITSLLDSGTKSVELQNAQMALSNEANARVLAGVRPGQYLSARQRREIANPEGPATHLARIGFHGGMANGKWTNDFDTWMAGRDAPYGRGADGKPVDMKPVWRDHGPLRKDTKVLGFQGRMIDAQDMPISDPATGKVDVSRDGNGNRVVLNPTSRSRIGVRRGSDGTITYTFGEHDGSNPAKNRYWQKKADEVAAESHRNKEWNDRLRSINEGLSAAGISPIDAYAASKGGETMRERGWLDAIFNGGITRAALRAGRTRK